MELKVEATYTIPITVNPQLKGKEQTAQALEYAKDVIRRLDVNSLKAWLVTHCKVVVEC